MARWISLIVLAAIVILVAVLFFQVMASFILPMFFALILVVMFRPLHRWMTEQCGGRVRVAAGITTGLTLLIVFLPLLAILSIAATEAVHLLADFDREKLQGRIAELRRQLDVELPVPDARQIAVAIDEHVLALERCVAGDDDPKRLPSTLSRLEDLVLRFEQMLPAWREQFSVPEPAPDADATDANVDDGDPSVAPTIDEAEVSAPSGPELAAQDAEPAASETATEDSAATDDSPTADEVDATADSTAPAEEGESEEDLSPEAEAVLRVERRVSGLRDSVNELRRFINRIPSDELGEPDFEVDMEMVHLRNSNQQFQTAFRDFEWQLMGGGVTGWLKLQANPSEERIEEWRNSVQEWLLPLALSTPKFLGGFLGRFFFGLVVMIISLYYFLADGPSMVAAIMRLSPLDDRYENRMLVEFDKISRAMVVATLLSAVVQGLLAGIGYYLAGLNAVFLLIVLTMFLSMVPFVGAASVWGACSLWLLFEGDTGAAIFLALYGGLVVSMIDNFIKPYVLHGRSNLHPLLALLSVLGGVQALGPIGIFVGPMVVAFLQALLEMFRGELDSLERGSIRQTT